MAREEQHLRQQFTAVTSRQHFKFPSYDGVLCYRNELRVANVAVPRRKGLFGTRDGTAIGYQRNKIF
jgi:hypothetical protein